MRRVEGLESLYIDFDSFFASAEQHLRPELRGRPVGVIPLASAHTSCIAASRDAKRLGIRTGTSIADARRLCPDITFVVARHDQYIRLHTAILDVVGRFLPIRAVRSIDEMWCTLMKNEEARANDIGRGIKRAIAERFSPILTCSIGLGPNELIAKIAAEMEKPDGLVAVAAADLPERLQAMQLTDIPGIANGNAARLARAGIGDFAGLWHLAPKQMRALWGSVEGERFWAFLHGYDIERPPTKRGMFGHSRVLARDWRTPDRVRDCARLLLVKAARRMRREGFLATTLMLGLPGQDGERWRAEERFRPVRDDHAVLESLDRLFAQARAGGAPARPLGVHVSLQGLVPGESFAPDLLDGADGRERQRWERLSAAIDELNARHAPVTFGPRVDLPGGYAGAKIAFGHVPSLADV